MIHFFPTFDRNAENSPYGEGLRQSGVPYRIFSGQVRFNYRSRFELFLVCIPRLAWFALRSALASMVMSRPPPSGVVLGSDVEVLIFAAVRALFFRRRVRIIYNGFIYTTRVTTLANRLRRAYFGFVLRRTWMVVVYSRLEETRYAALFRGARFHFIRWGGSIHRRRELMEQARQPHPPYIVAAGKSGRDYATLFTAMEGLDIELRVVCDLASAVPPIQPCSRITILARCHGFDYLREVAGATAVVIPLAVEDISAGQMVLSQAFALGRPVVVTDTATVMDYAADGETALLVPRGDAAAMRAALLRLLDDAPLRERLGAAGLAAFEADMDTPAHLRRLARMLDAELRAERPENRAGHGLPDRQTGLSTGTADPHPGAEETR
jgi:glycosyltransferase involved in cell wall biosynthesis